MSEPNCHTIEEYYVYLADVFKREDITKEQIVTHLQWLVGGVRRGWWDNTNTLSSDNL